MSALSGADPMAVALPMAQPTQAHEIRESVRLAVPVHAEVAERDQVVHFKRSPDLGLCTAAIDAAAISRAGFQPGESPRRAIRQLALGTAVAPVAVLLPARGGTVAETRAVAGFGAEPARPALAKLEGLAATLADAINPGALTANALIARLRAEASRIVSGGRDLDLEGRATSLAGANSSVAAVGVATSARAEQTSASVHVGSHGGENGAAMTAGTLYGHRTGLRCQTPAVDAARGHFASRLYTIWLGRCVVRAMGVRTNGG